MLAFEADVTTTAIFVEPYYTTAYSSDKPNPPACQTRIKAFQVMVAGSGLSSALKC